MSQLNIINQNIEHLNITDNPTKCKLNAIIGDSVIKSEIKCKELQVVLEINKAIDKMAEAFNLTKFDLKFEQVNDMKRLEKSKEMTKDVNTHELTKDEKANDLTRQKVVDDLTRLKKEKLTCQLCDSKNTFASKQGLTRHNNRFHKNANKKLDVAIKQTEN